MDKDTDKSSNLGDQQIIKPDLGSSVLSTLTINFCEASIKSPEKPAGCDDNSFAYYQNGGKCNRFVTGTKLNT